MADYTRLTDLEVTGEIKTPKVKLGVTKATYTATSADPAAAASSAPTKEEFDAAVTLLKELKSKHNKLVSQLTTGSDT